MSDIYIIHDIDGDGDTILMLAMRVTFLNHIL